MRLAVIGPTYPFRGGIAHHTTLLVKTLREEGHTVLFLSYTRQYPRWLYPGRDDKDPSKHPLTTETVYQVDSLNPLTWWQAAESVRKFSADQLIIPYWVPFWMPFCAFMGNYLRRFSSSQLTFLVHNALPHEIGRFDRLALRLALSSGHRFIAHAESQADILHQTFPSTPVLVTPLPTYSALGEVVDDQPLPLPQDKPILLFCGLIRPYKGLDILLDALPLILAHQEVHLAIVGEMWGVLEQEYLQQIERLGIASHISIENAYVSNERLTAYIKASTAVVLPYRSVTQSAIAELVLGLGAPIIVSDKLSLPDREMIFYYPWHDSVALAKTVCSFLQGKTDKVAPTTASTWSHFISLLVSN